MAEKWISGAIKHPGSLHTALGVPQGEKIPAKKLAKAAKSKSPSIRRKVALAKTLKGFHHHNPHASQPRHPTNPGEYDNEAHVNTRGKAERPSPAHLQENPGEADMYMQPRVPHTFRPPATSGAHGYRHTNKAGALRLSGHPGAHQIGRK
jgi:hypothetical protein